MLLPMTDALTPSNPPLAVAPHRIDRRRQIVLWTVALVLIAIATGVLVWWRAAAGSAHLDAAGEFWADKAWTMRAGDMEEMCFAVQPGSSVKFGFGVRNAGSHDMAITEIQPVLPVWPQQVSYTLESWKGGFEPLPEEHPFRPFAMRPGDTVMFYLTIQVPTEYPPSVGNHIYFDQVQMRAKVLGITRVRELPIGEFVGLDFVNAGAQPCAPVGPLV
jgi:hypothetical protein